MSPDARPGKRSERQCAYLVDSLTGIEFFKKTSRTLALEVAGVATYQQFDKGEPVFLQGDLGTAFYVILSGSVQIRVRDVNTKPEEYGYVAVTLGAGKGFGELALHADNAVRYARQG